jgi:hypothetical protein
LKLYKWLWNMNDDNICGDNYFSDPRDPVRRGRPDELTTWLLQDRRDGLLALFQRYWASFAWELEQARTPEQVREALRVIPRPRDVLDPFINPELRKSDRVALRRLRDRHSALRKLFPKSREREEETQRSLEDLNQAMAGQTLDARVFQYRDEYARRHRQARRRFEKLSRTLEKAQARISAEEAYIAQNELLSFFGNKRCEYSPRGLAVAMAGVPEVSWRRSAEKCKTLPPANPFDQVFEEFRHVERALKSPPKDEKSAVEQVKKYLLKKTTESDYAAQELRKNWYFLVEAIRAVYQQKAPKSAIPYRVYAEYQRREAVQRPVDRVLAREMTL